MMQRLFNTLIIFFMFSLAACQHIPGNEVLQRQSTSTSGQEQLLPLLRQGKRYTELSVNQQRSVCKRLKQDYKEQSDWQTAWLLVYALNSQFRCLNLNKTLNLLIAIEKAQNDSSQLKWFNKNQIKLLNTLNYFKKKNNNRGYLLKEVQIQLKQAQGQLEKLNSNIQELKAIETSINKKSQ